MIKYKWNSFFRELVVHTDGDYILFTDHEAAIKKAVEDEREELVNGINAMTWDDCLGRADVEQKILNMIRSRGEKP